MKKSTQEWVRVFKFVLFSASAGIIQIGSFTLLNEFTGWRYWPCYLISLLLSIFWNFTFNRRFTFKSNANITRAMLLVLAFYAVFTPATTILGDWLAEDLLWNEYLVTGINMLLNVSLEYLYQRYVVYRNRVDNRE
ncbi:MAG: GtrA family protein [Paludibacteraceae bacterium]|nr:GtrA family protein [Paludibacteraceae bacterium]